MSKQIPARRVARNSETTAREFWLAGLGAVSLARKQALSGIDKAGEIAEDLRERVERGADSARDLLLRGREGVEDSLTRGRSELDRAIAESQRLLERFRVEAEQRVERVRVEAERVLRPVLARVGLVEAKMPARQRATAKTPARKPTGNRRGGARARAA